jgi:hypothetical protein
MWLPYRGMISNSPFHRIETYRQSQHKDQWEEFSGQRTHSCKSWMTGQAVLADMDRNRTISIKSLTRTQAR